MKIHLLIEVDEHNVAATIARLKGTAASVQQVSNEDDDAGVADNNPVDADGIVWDARIHATTKTKTAKGVWKRLKGIEDAVYEAVKAELKAAANATVTNVAPASAFANIPAATLAPAAAPATPIQDTLSRLESHMGIAQPAVTAAVAPQAAPPASPMPTAAPAAVATPAPVTDPNDGSFFAFTQKLGRIYASGRVQANYGNELTARINEAWKGHNKPILNTLTDVQHDADLLKFAFELVKVDGFESI